VADSGSNSAAGVREGDVLAGKYRVERVLGIGGMGVVVAAHHIQLDEKVALKFLLPEALHNSDAVTRFAREARAAVKIKSEHVARVTDVGTLPDGAPYMVMEYLEGGDLAAWLKDRGALPIEQAVEFVLQACVAVADAHALGIIHRDLKPANLFCVRRSDGQLSIKVLDFGISKMTQFGASGPGAMTHASALMGSPLYMSPEQMRSARTVNSQTDIWALGTILFELLAGKPPFLADSLPELVIRASTEPPPPLRDSRPELPAGLEAVILRCLEKDRENRYPNVAELALALMPFAPKRAKASVERISGIIQAAGLSASVLAVPPSPQNPSTQASGGTLPAVSNTASSVPGGSARRGAVVGIVMAMGLGVVGAGALVVHVSGTPSPTASAVVATSPQPARGTPTRSVEAQPAATAVPSDPAPLVPTALPSPNPTARPTTTSSAHSGDTARAGAQPGPARPPVSPPFRPAPSSAPSIPQPQPQCDPPTWTDEKGHVHLKQGCQ
jgi:serine/threonine-protein kinase